MHNIISQWQVWNSRAPQAKILHIWACFHLVKRVSESPDGLKTSIFSPAALKICVFLKSLVLLLKSLVLLTHPPTPPSWQGDSSFYNISTSRCDLSPMVVSPAQFYSCVHPWIFRLAILGCCHQHNFIRVFGWCRNFIRVYIFGFFG